MLINSSCNMRTTLCLLEAFFCLKFSSVHQSDHKNKKLAADCLEEKHYFHYIAHGRKRVKYQNEKDGTEDVSVRAFIWFTMMAG